MTGATASMLPDGKRLHLQAGPIDLVIDADGDATEVARAFEQASQAFEPVLVDLVAELPLLRAPVSAGLSRLTGPVARRMEAAALNFAGHLVTPMISVAGAVADHVLSAMMVGRDLDRVYVNNGGDIALYLKEGQVFDIGIVSRVDAPEISMRARVRNADGVGGIATSGWRGRSFSLGVADAVTVLASDAALADVAATLIANEIDPGLCPQVERTPAHDLDPDSDLGERFVTTAVHPLSDGQVSVAMDRGQVLAQRFVGAGFIVAAALSLQGRTAIAGQLTDKQMHNIEQTGEACYAVG